MTLIVLELSLLPLVILISAAITPIICLLWYTGMVIWEEVKYGKETK